MAIRKEKESEEKVIRIPTVSRGVVQVTLRSVEGSSLLMHRKSQSVLDQIAKRQKQMPDTEKRAAKDPQKEFENAAYKDEKGWYIPGSWAKAAIVDAAPYSGMFKKTVRQTVHVLGDKHYFTQMSEPKVNETLLPINRGSGMDWRIRPEIEQWEVKIPVVFNRNATSVEQIFSLFDSAGFHCGFGDNRPNSPKTSGSHGLFRVVRDKE